MAFVVARPHGRWEARESFTTASGPRSRTLASFDVLTEEVAAHASARSSRGATPAEVRAAARKAGAPVAPHAADRAASDLLDAIARGDLPRPALRRVLVDALAGEVVAPPTDSELAAAAWVDRTPRERADALHDLLLLADHLPEPRRRTARRFPRLASGPA
ncbi:hypothetical protein [Conexibacter woesei]|uniref:Uncharacterized protein n=1 Tax=Conexibacter woesei (strain DSM 14684 / CCUG 47730 / CIP 108061 / JCM 11494 / NBRC 100937 / ID131577) TaxID=469383 RepID=D3FC51_CONWI|nr:hypothetical protein [Conexibacter woesei]ADB53346.1 hypothetical protein Cwoe_4935 [Conexibacter woesei DSM 14684]